MKVKELIERQELTDEQIIQIARETQTAEPGRDGYILPLSFARAVLAASSAPPLIEIEYELGGRWWHMNCKDDKGNWVPSGIMREVERDNEGRRSLIRCMRCKQQGYYQFGWVGLARVPSVLAASLAEGQP